MKRLHRHLRSAVVITGAVLGIITIAGVGMNLWVRVKGSGHLYEEAVSVPPKPTAVVPGASVYSDGRPSPALKDRLEAALSLYEAGVVKQILVSGLREGPHYDEVTAMSRWLTKHGVPRSALLE
ncbi:MAG: ElyC/SanA/YdcF family protein, partial [Myxococcota bacterium]|nr:ElyC/SanA/YdcF family protein [Myxococcota bacterium]